jgi:hypothetical protein
VFLPIIGMLLPSALKGFQMRSSSYLELTRISRTFERNATTVMADAVEKVGGILLSHYNLIIAVDF